MNESLVYDIHIKILEKHINYYLYDVEFRDTEQHHVYSWSCTDKRYAIGSLITLIYKRHRNFIIRDIIEE